MPRASSKHRTTPRQGALRAALLGLVLAGGSALLPTGAGPAWSGVLHAQEPPSDGARPTSCPPGEEGSRRALQERVNELRAEAGLDPVEAEPALCTVAQGRAEDMAAAGSLDSSETSIRSVSRSLRAQGYEAHRWTERALLGWETPVRMLERWARSEPQTLHRTVLGPFEELGIGVARGEDGTAVSLLLAVPRSTELRRLTAPLRDLDEVRARALERVNEARRSVGRPPLEPDPRLDAAAQRYAEEMLERGHYAHVGPEGSTPRIRAEEAGYGPIAFVAENLAKGLFEPAEAVDRWLQSPDHRNNILDARSTDVGLGVAFGDTDDGFQVLWVQLFGRER